MLFRSARHRPRESPVAGPGKLIQGRHALTSTMPAWGGGGPGDDRPTRLGRWLVASLLLHVLAFLSWNGVRQLALQRPEAVPQWVRNAVLPPPPKPEPAKPLQPRPENEQAVEIPLQFLEVDPALVTDQEPKNTPFYSTANTLAGNPNPPVAEIGRAHV